MGGRWGGGMGETVPPLRLDPRTIQPVASRYTDYATPARACRDAFLFRTSLLHPYFPFLRTSICQPVRSYTIDRLIRRSEYCSIYTKTSVRSLYLACCILRNYLYPFTPGTREHTIHNSKKGCICNRRSKNQQFRISVHWTPHSVVNLSSPYFLICLVLSASTDRQLWSVTRVCEMCAQKVGFCGK